MTLFGRRSMEKWSDQKLLEEVYGGNEGAIVYFFYTKFASTFQYHIYHIFPYRVDIDELVDEFFLYMQENDWRRLRTFDGSKSSLATWVSTVSFRFFKNYKTTKIDFNGVISISDKWETLRGDWVESHDAGIMMDLQNSISQIKSERDRQIAEKIFILDVSFERIAEEFGMTTDYVYTVKNRIVKQLKNTLNGYGNE